LQTTLAADDARFSPDGKTLALTLSPAIGAEDLYLLDLGSSDLRRVTSDNAKIHGLDWSPDGRSLVYASNRGGSFGLHRLPRDGGEPVSLMPSLQDLENPSLAGRRIAYEAWSETGELKTLRIRTGSSKSALTFPTDSTRLEWHPDVASDGAVAFVSDRGGAPEIWLSHDGKTRQLTHFGNAYIHTPKFSPDGKRIAFSAPQAGHFNLYLVDRNGTLSRLTNVSANDMSPAWSRDGRTLYFASDREAGWRPWKVDIADGAAVQISRTPARAVYVEGESELLVVDPVKGGLHRIELERPDAPATRLIAGIVPSDWANVALKGTSIFYISREPPDRAVLRRFDRASGRDTALATLDDFYFRSGLAVANDDTLVYAVTRTDDVSLMLLEYQTLVAY
jgi:Tol biopolymer transport system component